MANKEIVIHIDKKMFKIDQDALTGAQIRALPDPDIASNYELVLQVPGGDDRQIGEDESVALTNGMHFFSVPKNLDAGYR